MKKLLIIAIIIGISSVCSAEYDPLKSEFENLYDSVYPKTIKMECTTLVRYKDSRTYYDPDENPEGPPQYIKNRYLKDKYVKDSAERYNVYGGESYRHKRYYGNRSYSGHERNYGNLRESVRNFNYKKYQIYGYGWLKPGKIK